MLFHKKMAVTSEILGIAGSTEAKENDPHLDKLKAEIERNEGNDDKNIQAAFDDDIAQIELYLRKAKEEYSAATDAPDGVLEQIEAAIQDFKGKKEVLTKELQKILEEGDPEQQKREMQRFLVQAEQQLSAAITNAGRAEDAYQTKAQEIMTAVADKIPTEGIAAKWMLDMVEGLRGLLRGTGMESMFDDLMGSKFETVYGKDVTEKLAQENLLFQPTPMGMKTLIRVWRREKEASANTPSFGQWFDERLKGESFTKLKGAIESHSTEPGKFLYTPEDFIKDYSQNGINFNTIFGAEKKDNTHLRQALDSGQAETQAQMRTALDEIDFKKLDFQGILSLVKNPESETVSGGEFGDNDDWKDMVKTRAESELLAKYSAKFVGGKTFVPAGKEGFSVTMDQEDNEKWIISYEKEDIKNSSPEIEDKNLKTAMEFLGGKKDAGVLGSDGNPKAEFGGGDAKDFWENAMKTSEEDSEEAERRLKEIISNLGDLAVMISNIPEDYILESSDAKKLELRKGHEILTVTKDGGGNLAEAEKFHLDPEAEDPKNPLDKNQLKAYLETWAKDEAEE